MKKKLIMLAVTVGLLLALPACAGQSDGEKDQNAKSQSSVAQDSASISENISEEQNSGSGQTMSGITEEAAKTLAFQQADVDEAEVLASAVREDRDDGQNCYEVVFYTKDADYEYIIDRMKGTLIESDKETFDFSWGTPEGAGITKEEAQSIIMEKVPGVEEDNIRMKAEVEQGRILYEGEVIYGNSKYEYEMDAQTGELLEWSQGDLF